MYRRHKSIWLQHLRAALSFAGAVSAASRVMSTFVPPYRQQIKTDSMTAMASPFVPSSIARRVSVATLSSPTTVPRLMQSARAQLVTQVGTSVQFASAPTRMGMPTPVVRMVTPTPSAKVSINSQKSAQQPPPVTRIHMPAVGQVSGSLLSSRKASSIKPTITTVAPSSGRSVVVTRVAHKSEVRQIPVKLPTSTQELAQPLVVQKHSENSSTGVPAKVVAPDGTATPTLIPQIQGSQSKADAMPNAPSRQTKEKVEAVPPASEVQIGEAGSSWQQLPSVATWAVRTLPSKEKPPPAPPADNLKEAAPKQAETCCTVGLYKMFFAKKTSAASSK